MAFTKQDYLYPLAFIPYNRPMRKLFLSCFLLGALTSAAFSAQAAGYTYDQARSKVLFTLKNFGITTVDGHFNQFSGTFEFDPANIQSSNVKLRIQTASLATSNGLQDRQLKSKGFFWPEKFPDIIFISREFKNIEGERFNIYGDLTIRGKTMPVIFKTKLLTPVEKISSDRPLRFYTETYIQRKDYNLGTGNIFDPLMTVTHETLKISLEVEGQPVHAETAPQ